MANLYSKEALLKRKFHTADSIDEHGGVTPTVNVPDIVPFFTPNEKIVKADLKLPGCPPITEDIVGAIVALLENKPIVVPRKSVCDECPRKKEDKKLVVLKRVYEGIPDPEKCLLEQGYFCIGPATRAGCHAQCTSAGMPCRGCYGPIEGVEDQGAKMMSTLASICTEIPTDTLVAAIKDPAGTFYRFNLPQAIIGHHIDDSPK